MFSFGLLRIGLKDSLVIFLKSFVYWKFDTSGNISFLLKFWVYPNLSIFYCFEGVIFCDMFSVLGCFWAVLYFFLYEFKTSPPFLSSCLNLELVLFIVTIPGYGVSYIFIFL